jgi:2,4-didehydro-3-deoxy-L-rhamnonate hydrolase
MANPHSFVDCELLAALKSKEHMKLANVSGKASLILDGKALDVDTASGGVFGPDLASVYAKWDEFAAWAATVSPGASNAVVFAESDLGPVSPSPAQVYAIGLNYRAHAAEGGRDVPKAPATFTKFPTCLGGPFDPVASVPGRHDWEAELVVVIGRRAHKIGASDAWSYVAGVTCGQDYSERDTQNASGGHFSLGKSYPGFGPTGPWLVTPDELANPDDLAISCEVSGQVMQSSRTSNMVFSVSVLIEYISAITPLLPGDIIFTGTPEGVGYARKPPRLLAAGDVVVTTIEGIGTIRQNIV